MSRVSPKMRRFAGQLVAYEGARGKSHGPKIPAAFVACEKLRPHLATLMGKAGFRALLARALALATAEVSWLSAMKIGEDGALEGLDQLESGPGKKAFAEESVVLLACLLGLLEAFIGENLTRRLLGEVWPKLPRDNSNLGKGDKK